MFDQSDFGQHMTMEVEQKVTIFHITGIVCSLLTLFLSPLIMILPLILFFFVQDSLREKNNPQLHVVNYSICLLMTVIWAILLIIAVVVTLLLAFPVLLFLIPFVVVLLQLTSVSPIAGR
jgi:hypothetical protein